MEIEELPVLLAADAAPGEFAAGRNTEVAIIRQGYGDVDAVYVKGASSAEQVTGTACRQPDGSWRILLIEVDDGLNVAVFG
jgi:hypothetical protein